MSQENVEIVRRLQPGPDVDLTVLFRDETTSTVAMDGPPRQGCCCRVFSNRAEALEVAGLRE
jgi:hypothetical protein